MVKHLCQCEKQSLSTHWDWLSLGNNVERNFCWDSDPVSIINAEPPISYVWILKRDEESPLSGAKGIYFNTKGHQRVPSQQGLEERAPRLSEGSRSKQTWAPAPLLLKVVPWNNGYANSKRKYSTASMWGFFFSASWSSYNPFVFKHLKHLVKCDLLNSL